MPKKTKRVGRAKRQQNGVAALHEDAPPYRINGDTSRRGRIAPPPVARLTEKKKLDRKSTRLNSSHRRISYGVFCLKKKRWCDGIRATGVKGQSDKQHHSQIRMRINSMGEDAF